LFSSIEKLIALRNLRPKKKEGFLKVISAFSFVGIALGVAVLIIVMSVMNGFRTDLTNKILGFNPHLIVKPYNNVKINDDFKKQLNNNIKEIEYLESFSGEGVVIKSETTKGVIIKGLDQKSQKNLVFLKKILIEGNNDKIESNEVVIGKQLAIDLNLQVGDKINLLSSSFIGTPFGGLPKQETYIVQGVFSSGFYEFDQNVIFLNLNQTLDFFIKTE
jgi:lipoprotein-releasing system permease protein